ncbi:hypothetical protein [Humisphaera borealis]|uniref:Porin n=1 Tax=Humisphaera borealis TaxID=2807512 RepID=A0A7M2WVM1_9BACT|nr:hypothetical protein [Humisphaera borealis]QOV89535.1 hypothetical protein IPV69_25645 [Humisphaera borealis]
MKRTSRVFLAALVATAGLATQALAADGPFVLGPTPPSKATAPAPDTVLGPPRPQDGAAQESVGGSGFGLNPFASAPRETTADEALANMESQPFSLKVTNSDLVFTDKVLKRVANPTMGQSPTEHPVYLAADAAETPNIHGFIEAPFKTAYVTPRGLVVENSGVVFQPVGGFVIPIGDAGPLKGLTFVTGVWTSFNSAQNDTNVGSWNETDYFASFSWNVDKFSFNLTYGAWGFPQSTEAKPSTEHNIDLKISFDDSKVWGDSGFSLNPYVDLWWAVAGSSTVVLGKQGDTGYVEIGIVPTYTVKAAPDMPIKLAFPTYFSVGPEGYWDATASNGNFGVFSTSVNATIPLNFIPARMGHWHATAGLTYFYLMNQSLLEAGTILSGNDNRNVFVGSLGIGMNF